MIQKIEISHRTIIFTLLLILGLWFFFQIKDILFLLFISFIVMSALHPLVDFFARFRLPRFITILVIYGLVFGFLGVSFASTIPALVGQTTKLATDLPLFIERILPYWNIDTRAIANQIAPISQNILKVTVGIFTNIVTTLTVLVFTFYFLLEHHNSEQVLKNFLGDTMAKQVLLIIREIEQRLGAWVSGEFLLMSIIGVMTYIGLSILKVEFALPLAILAGLLEIVPTIGPILSAVPAVLVALATSPMLALFVVALFFLVQQFENNLIVPMVMKKSLGLSPLVTILSLMIGGRLAGFVGAVLAVPILLVLQVLLRTFLTQLNKDK